MPSKKETFERTKTFSTKEETNVKFLGWELVEKPTRGGEGRLQFLIKTTKKTDVWYELHIEGKKQAGTTVSAVQPGTEFPIATDFQAPDADEFDVRVRGGYVANE